MYKASSSFENFFFSQGDNTSHTLFAGILKCICLGWVILSKTYCVDPVLTSTQKNLIPLQLNQVTH